MALVFFDGFDHVSSTDYIKKWNASGGGAVVQSAVTRLGVGNALKLTSVTSGGWQTSHSFAASDTIVCGWAFRFPQISASCHIWACGYGGYGGVSQMGLSISTAGNLQAVRGSNNPGVAPGSYTSFFNTPLGSPSANTLAPNIWYFIEVKTVIHDSAGTFEVRVNGSNVGWINLTGQDTRNSNATATVAGFGHSVSGAEVAYLDDCYIINGDASDAANPYVDFLGDVRVVTRIASTGNGAMTGFTPLASTDRGAMVDDTATDDDTTYNASAAAGDIDTYNFAALGTSGAVKAVQVSNYIKKSTSGTCSSAAVARVGTTNYLGTELPAATDYNFQRHIFVKNPATSALWTPTEVDAAEFGLKHVV